MRVWLEWLLLVVVAGVVFNTALRIFCDVAIFFYERGL